MRINQLKMGVILTYCTQFVNILTGLIYTPVMLRLLGQSEYGLYQLVQSVVSYLSLLSMGFGAGYIRVYSKYKVNDDNEGIARLNGMFATIFSVISVICLLCGIVMVGNVKTIFGDGLTGTELDKSKILLAIMVFNLAATLMNSIFNCYATAKEKFFFQKAIVFFKSLLNPFITLPLLIMGYGSVGMVLVTTFLTIASLATDIWFCIKKLAMKFEFRGFDLKLLKNIWVFTFFIFMNMIIDQINWSIDKFLLGRFVGTIAVAVYGVASSLNSMYLMFSTAVSSVFVPRVNRLVVTENDNKKLTHLFTRVGRIQFVIMALIISGYILFGKEFINFWAGKGYDESYYVGMLLMLPATVPLIQNLGIEIRRAQNKHKIPALFMFVVALLNVGVSIPLIKLYGATGAAVGTAAGLFVNIVFVNIYYHKKCNVNIVYFWKEIFKLVPGQLISMSVGLVVKSVMNLNNIWNLGMCIIVYGIVYLVVVYLVGLNDYEKGLIKVFRKRRIHNDRNR